ncbi:hypothetical protein CDL12_18429 [Handroanthus impetiginosus]|uniref:DUF7392 domain-containing protein n=1 Tax=Handroanthus impetiginosus TaxID=429701 RepID=A0A2G9GUM7_9LAMI|nr:hypothetical protein CDL12_18429 [Handroanthus impetiginosus]
MTIFPFSNFKHGKILVLVFLSIHLLFSCIIKTPSKQKKRYVQEDLEKEMACYAPFNNRNMDINFYVFRPTVVYADDLVDALKQFSMYTGNLGCVHSSIFRSIHGNMIVWYGAWMKRSDENKQQLGAALLSVLSNVARMAVLMDHGFFEAYAGESRDGSPAAKFFTGDIVSLNSATLSTKDSEDNSGSYAWLAIFKDRFCKTEGARAGICFRSHSTRSIVAFFVWESLQFCYSFILASDCRRTILPYLDGFAVNVKYDVFRVVYVSGENVDVTVGLYSKNNRTMENEVERNGAYSFVQDFRGR